MSIARVLRIFVPFAAGYLLSYLFRTINGPLADRLVGEFRWDARTLGLLTSAYFLTFAAFQLPLGALIDRFGPRRVQALLSLVAASGALLFGLGNSLAVLVIARALIAQAGVTWNLLAMGAALASGAVALGILANRLRTRGFSSAALFAGACMAFLLIQSIVIAHIRIPAWLIWPCFAVFGSMTVLSYTMLADLFAPETIGRANGALNVLHLGMAFVIQSVIGMVTNLWPADAIGRYPAIAYRAAFAVPFTLQLLALAWFLLSPIALRLLRRGEARLASPHGLGAR